MELQVSKRPCDDCVRKMVEKRNPDVKPAMRAAFLAGWMRSEMHLGSGESLQVDAMFERWFRDWERDLITRSTR